MKNIIIKTIFGLILVSFLIIILITFSNELTFKFYNQQGITNFKEKKWIKSYENFQQAALKFKTWELAVKNNQLAIFYEQKKYFELNKKLKDILKNDCSLSATKISNFCENIFYLNGLTQYRLGENLEIKKQKKYFEQAILEFKKTLALNPDNIWAKENIDFILKNFEKKQKQKKQQNQKSNKQTQQSSKQTKSNQNSQEKEEQTTPNNKTQSSTNKIKEKNKKEEKRKWIVVCSSGRR